MEGTDGGNGEAVERGHVRVPGGCGWRRTLDGDGNGRATEEGCEFRGKVMVGDGEFDGSGIQRLRIGV